MDNTLKSMIASAVAALAVVIVALTFFAPHSVTTLQKIVAGGNPDFSNSPYLTINGVTEWYSQQAMASGRASTTVCSIQAPTASSSINFVSVRMGGILSSGVTFTIGTSTNAVAATGVLTTGTTSTSSGYMYLGSQGQNLNSGEYINVVLSALATTTGGTCQAEFTQF